MKLIVLMTFVFGLVNLACGQDEKINQYDAKGKKTGRWKVFVDAEGDEVKDSTKASYYRFTYYDNGQNCYPMGGWCDDKWKLTSTDKGNAQGGKIILADGEYTCTDNKNVVRFINVFDKGEYVMYKEYYANGKIKQVYDYLKMYKGEKHSYAVTMYDKKGSPQYYYMRNGNKGWAFYWIDQHL